MAPTAKAMDLNANHDAEIIGVVVAFTVLTLFAFTLRAISRRMKRIAFGLEDVLLTLALMAAMTECIWIAVATRSCGLGRHISTLSEGQIINFEKLFYATGLLQPTALALTKLSVLILFHRIFATRAFRITTYTLGAIVTLWYIAVMFADAFICLPVESAWNPAIPANCGNQRLLQIITPLPWIITDFAILIAPIPIVRKLHLPLSQRVALSGLFLLGGLTCITSCIRYSGLWFSIKDVTWDITVPTLWNVVEAYIRVRKAENLTSTTRQRPPLWTSQT